MTLVPPTSREEAGESGLVPADAFEIAGIPGAGAAVGVAVTTGALNTKGAWAQLTAASGIAAAGFVLDVCPIGPAEFLVDVGIGAGGSEVVLVSNLLVSVVGVAEGVTVASIPIPVAIPAGSRISIRAQASVATQTLYCSAVLYSGDVPGSTSCETLGALTAGSGGTVIDPGAVAGTKGAWSELVAATAAAIKACVLLIGGGADASRVNAFWALDIGVGGAGSEVVKVPNVQLRASGTVDIVYPQVIVLPLGIPAGSRVAVRAACDIAVAGDRLFYAVLLGIHESA